MKTSKLASFLNFSFYRVMQKAKQQLYYTVIMLWEKTIKLREARYFTWEISLSIFIPEGYISFIIMDNVQTSLLQMLYLYLPRLFTIQTLLKTYSESEEQVVLWVTRCIEKQENHGELLPDSTDSTCSWKIYYTGSLSPPRAVVGTSLMLTLPEYSSTFPVQSANSGLTIVALEM